MVQSTLSFSRCSLCAGIGIVRLVVGTSRGCGLGLDVSVSRCWSQSCLEKHCQCLGLGHLRLVPKTSFLMGMQMAPYTV